MSITSAIHSHRALSRTGLFAGAVGVALLTAACGGSSTSTAAPASGGATTGAAHSSTSPSPSTAAVSVATAGVGKILVDGQGRTMYGFAADTKGHSNCNGSCLVYWPAVKAGTTPPTDMAGVTATFGVLHRSDGTSQLTVNGWPMYTYAGDSKAGQTKGQGLNNAGGLWWVVNASGKWITKATTSGTTSTKSTTGRYGSGY
jgi:predicted lipoprotein with Yx(FWY)xxD motif